MQPSKTKSEHRISLSSFSKIINPFNTSQFKSSSLSYLLIPLLVGIFSAPSYCNESPSGQAATSNSKTIAITQIVTHPSADQTRMGVIDGLKENGYEEGKNLNIIFENPQGNMSIAMQIAQKFVSLKPDVIVPITTPSAQTVLGAAKNTDIPIVFASVTDPINASIVKSLEKPGGTVTGATDYPPIESTLNEIKALMPNAKTIGMIYNPGEINSTKMVELFEQGAIKNGLQIVRQTAINTSDVRQAALALVDKVDAFLICLDNTALSSMTTILNVAASKDKPVFSNDPDSVPQGVLMGISNTQYDTGFLAGKIIARILNGENAGDIDVAAPKNPKIFLNTQTAQKLGIVFPPELTKKATTIFPEPLEAATAATATKTDTKNDKAAPRKI
ncbi:MAG: ABC transporter substrate-binding protein [Alphaproteobacteria bacterium]|nr:ABC transporter substrate-binding protein [Alphaproteobacteria bacterium]